MRKPTIGGRSILLVAKPNAKAMMMIAASMRLQMCAWLDASAIRRSRAGVGSSPTPR